MPTSRVAQVFAEEWPKLVATLRRELGDLDLAEEAAQEAFTLAATKWGPDSTPDRPGAWLLTAARRRAIDQIRRDARFADRLPALAQLESAPGRPDSDLIDDQLALIFGCCHDSLNTEAQIALTLRDVCGLSTAQIAQAFLVSTPTMAKRLVRAKDKIRKANIPFVVPSVDELPERLDAVLSVVYLIFTAGHANADGPALVRGDLCDEARWLAGVVDHLLTRSTRADVCPGLLGEVRGLVALMRFTDARRETRLDGAGHLILLEDQDRSRWDQQMIAEGRSVLESALGQGPPGPYQLQAAIAGLHATAPQWDETDWPAIVALYTRLAACNPSPVIELNRAAAVAMTDGPAVGLDLIDALGDTAELDSYRYFHAARADLLRRLGRVEEASDAYRSALTLTSSDAERRFLDGRLRSLRTS